MEMQGVNRRAVMSDMRLNSNVMLMQVSSKEAIGIQITIVFMMAIMAAIDMRGIPSLLVSVSL